MQITWRLIPRHTNLRIRVRNVIQSRSNLLQYIYIYKCAVTRPDCLFLSKALRKQTEHQIPAFGLQMLIIYPVAIHLGRKICPSVNMRVNTCSLLALFKSFHIL
jgi:hypothetical protein